MEIYFHNLEKAYRCAQRSIRIGGNKMKAEEKFSPGLDGVVAAETKISFLDTVKGEIVIQGYDLIELSKTKSYLDIVHLY